MEDEPYVVEAKKALRNHINLTYILPPLGWVVYKDIFVDWHAKNLNDWRVQLGISSVLWLNEKRYVVVYDSDVKTISIRTYTQVGRRLIQDERKAG